jgi:hypothetical protein
VVQTEQIEDRLGFFTNIPIGKNSMSDFLQNRARDEQLIAFQVPLSSPVILVQLFLLQLFSIVIIAFLRKTVFSSFQIK